MPVVEIAPPVVARPWIAASRLSSDQRTPPCARSGPRLRVDVDAPHLRQVDHQPAVGHGPAGDVVAAAAHRHLQPALAAEQHGLRDVGRPPAARDDRRPLVDEAVVDPAGLVVARLAGAEQPAGEPGRELRHPLVADRRGRHGHHPPGRDQRRRPAPCAAAGASGTIGRRAAGCQGERLPPGMRIEDYGLIGDLQTAALVGRNGSIDWLCLPRFDSARASRPSSASRRTGAGWWRPTGEVRSRSRRYRPGTLVLETDVETADGSVRVIDFMPRRRDGPPQVVRIVEGISGTVPMRSVLALRPDYGAIVPWIEPVPDGALRHRRAGLLPPQHAAPARRGRRRDRGRLSRRRRLADALRHELAQLIGAQPAGRERRLRAGPYRGLVERLVGQMHL